MPRINFEMLTLGTGVFFIIFGIPIGLLTLLIYVVFNIEPRILLLSAFGSTLVVSSTAAIHMLTVNYRPPPSLGVGKCDGCSETAQLHKAVKGKKTLKLCDSCIYK